MKRVRGGSGLGDSIYIRSIVDYYIRRGERVTVCSNYPELFIGSGAIVEPFGRERIDVLAHYASRKADPTTNQWQDICISAGVPRDLALRIDWKIGNGALMDRLLSDAAGRPLILVHGGRTPMARIDGFGAELLPDRAAFDIVMEALQGCFTVGIGQAKPLYRLPVEMDLTGMTSVSDLLDLGSVCDGAVGQCSYIIPLAEAFDKPLLVVWSAAGLASRTPYVRQITPQKILSNHRKSRFLMDDSEPETIYHAAENWKVMAAAGTDKEWPAREVVA